MANYTYTRHKKAQQSLFQLTQSIATIQKLPAIMGNLNLKFTFLYSRRVVSKKKLKVAIVLEKTQALKLAYEYGVPTTEITGGYYYTYIVIDIFFCSNGQVLFLFANRIFSHLLKLTIKRDDYNGQCHKGKHRPKLYN